MRFLSYVNENKDKQDAQWITIKKDDNKGRHVLINKKGIVIGGLGGKFNGVKVDDLFGEDFDKKALKGKVAHKSASFQSTLTDKEKLAVFSYTGQNYTRINKQLRGKEDKSPYIQDIIKNLDKAMKKASTQEDIISYRGVSSAIFDKMEIGAIVKDKGFTSTTTKMNVAKGFAASAMFMDMKSGKTDIEPLIMEIRIPKGSRAVSVLGYTTHKNEEEILIDRDSEYRVADIQKGKVIVELVQQ